jgi:hypothetical protein
VEPECHPDTLDGGQARPDRPAWPWIISNQTIIPSGRVFVLPDVAACNTDTQQQCNRFLATQHLRRRITYQPASRFWAFQAYETAILAVLSLDLAGFSVWWIRSRRLAR